MKTQVSIPVSTSLFLQLAEFLRQASVTVKENAGRLAVEKRIVEPNRVKTIEEFTGVNVLAALKRQSDLETASKE